MEEDRNCRSDPGVHKTSELGQLPLRMAMLSVPNVIQCADSEILVIGDDGASPVEGYKNIRRDEYYELIRIKVTAWWSETQKRLYKTEHLFYIELDK